MKDKICALVRQTWYETAKKNLKGEERLRFYEIIFEYEFNSVLPDDDAPFAARLLFDMVRADIDADKEKAAARAERSRINGSRGGRPKLAEDNKGEENPVGYSETQKTSIYKHKYTTSTSTQQKETDVENEDTHMFFNICLLFFEKGCSDPCREANTFWHYYEAMGWKTKGGGEVVDRLALAKAWRLQDCSKTAMRNRAPYADLMHKANPTEICLISDFVSMTRNATTQSVEIVLLEKSTCLLLDHKYMPALRSWIPVKDDGQPFALSYKALNSTID